MKCLLLYRKDKKEKFSCSKAYTFLGCRCLNCKKWKSENNKKWRKPKVEYKKQYYIKNKEKILKYQKEKYLLNKKKIREYQKKYFASENGKEANRRGARKRRTRKYNNGYVPYKESDVIYKYGIFCYLCKTIIDLSAPRVVGKPGWQNGLHIEHVVDLSMGGPDTIENVRPSHAICNLTKNTIKNDIISNIQL